MSDVRLIQGDCLDVLRTLEPDSVDAVVTDPPYGIGYHSNHYKGKNPHAPVTNDWNFQVGLFLQECSRVLKDGGAMYLFCRWDVTPLWLPYVGRAGLKVKTVVAWVKDNWSAGDLNGCFGNQYEQILFITKGRHLLRGRRWSNVWEFPRVPAAKMLHPTQKPVPLLERAIQASTDEGDFVVDCFAGSGSTGEAAQRTGRKCLLSDIDPKMLAISARRLGIHLENETSDEAKEIAASPLFLPPDPSEWGIHPEDLRAVVDCLQGNVERIAQAQSAHPLLAEVNG